MNFPSMLTTFFVCLLVAMIGEALACTTCKPAPGHSALSRLGGPCVDENNCVGDLYCKNGACRPLGTAGCACDCNSDCFGDLFCSGGRCVC